jgi:cyclin-dependent kinase-like
VGCYTISGYLSLRHREIFQKNPLFAGMRLPVVKEVEPMEKKFPRLSSLSVDFMKVRIIWMFRVTQVLNGISSHLKNNG